MNRQDTYCYNFEYSLANYQPLNDNEQGMVELQSSLEDQILMLEKSNELITFKCFLNKETQQIAQTLFTHLIQFYGRTAARLFRISSHLHKEIDCNVSGYTKISQHNLDHQRQKLIESLQELSLKLGNQKEKYLKLISLFVASAIYKILTLEKKIQNLEFQVIFHEVYWQIAGKHSTSKILKDLLASTLNMQNFDRYLTTQMQKNIRMSMQVGSHNKFQRGKRLNFDKIPMQRSLVSSFRNIQTSIKNSYKDLSHKVPEKVMPIVSFSKITRKKDKIGKQNVSIVNQKIHKDQKDIKNSINKQIGARIQLNNKSSTENLKVSNFNFKKDKNPYFQNFLNSQSGKKISTAGIFGNKILQKQLQRAINFPSERR